MTSSPLAAPSHLASVSTSGSETSTSVASDESDQRKPLKPGNPLKRSYATLSASLFLCYDIISLALCPCSRY